MIKAEDNITLKSNKPLYDNAQYFWQTSTGTDTGAHITEIPKEEFVATPSGANLLARSNGIALRQGTAEVATFSQDEIVLGARPKGRAVITESSLRFVPDYGSSDFTYARRVGVQITQTHIGDGVTTTFPLFRCDDVTVTVDGVTESVTPFFPTSDSLGRFIFASAPSVGAVIVATYTTTWANPFYSFGINSVTAPYGYAEGRNNTVGGIFGHAEGSASTANGSYAHAQNHGTMASGEAQTAIGKYNVEDATSAYAFIVGNGTASARSDALEVTWDGDILMADDTAISTALSTLGW